MAAWLFLVLEKLRLLLIHHHLRLVLFLLSFWANVTLWCSWLIQIEFRISLVELLLYALNWYLAVSLLARMERLLQPHRASQAADFFCHGSWQKSLLVLRFLLQLHGFVLFGCINSSLIANDKVLIGLYMLLPTHLIRRNANRVHVFFDVTVVGSDLLTACLLCLFVRLADQQGRVHAAVRYCWIEHELVSSPGWLDSAATVVSSSQQRITECAGGAKPSKSKIWDLTRGN